MKNSSCVSAVHLAQRLHKLRILPVHLQPSNVASRWCGLPIGKNFKGTWCTNGLPDIPVEKTAMPPVSQGAVKCAANRAGK